MNNIYRTPFIIAEIGNNHEGKFEIAKNCNGGFWWLQLYL